MRFFAFSCVSLLPIVLYLLCRDQSELPLMPSAGVLHSTLQEEAGNKDMGGRWKVVSRNRRSGSTERPCVGMEGEVGTTGAGMLKGISAICRRKAERGLTGSLQLG